MTTFRARWLTLSEAPASLRPFAQEESLPATREWCGEWVKISEVPIALAKRVARRYEERCGGRVHILTDLQRATVLLEADPVRLDRLLPLLLEEAEPIHDALAGWFERFQRIPAPWSLRHGLLRFAQGRPWVMGIVNVTPDSFSDGGRYHEPQKAIDHALRLIDEGADLLDIGGESTRPGSQPVSDDEECARILPVLEGLVPQIAVPISVDTTKATVAKAAVEAGAEILNDISCMRFDPALAPTAAALDIPVIVMHSRHTPANMQQSPSYANLWDELLVELEQGIETLHDAGADPAKIAVDPGIGFGKRQQDNYRILREIPVLRGLGMPIVIGASRKSFLGKVVDQKAPHRLEGSLAAAAVASWQGAHIVRVHDVAETRRLLAVMEAVQCPPLPR